MSLTISLVLSSIPTRLSSWALTSFADDADPAVEADALASVDLVEADPLAGGCANAVSLRVARTTAVTMRRPMPANKTRPHLANAMAGSLSWLREIIRK